MATRMCPMCRGIFEPTQDDYCDGCMDTCEQYGHGPGDCPTDHEGPQANHRPTRASKARANRSEALRVEAAIVAGQDGPPPDPDDPMEEAEDI